MVASRNKPKEKRMRVYLIVRLAMGLDVSKGIDGVVVEKVWGTLEDAEKVVKGYRKIFPKRFLVVDASVQEVNDRTFGIPNAKIKLDENGE